MNHKNFSPKKLHKKKPSSPTAYLCLHNHLQSDTWSVHRNIDIGQLTALLLDIPNEIITFQLGKQPPFIGIIKKIEGSEIYNMLLCAIFFYIFQITATYHIVREPTICHTRTFSFAIP